MFSLQEYFWLMFCLQAIVCLIGWMIIYKKERK